MCVGCRGRAVQTGLLRAVVIEGILVPDPRGRQPGRGVYVHPTIGCLDRAERRRAFPRALRCRGPLDTSALRAHLEAQRQNTPAGDVRDGDEHRVGNGS